jgi:MFS family permease
MPQPPPPAQTSITPTQQRGRPELLLATLAALVMVVVANNSMGALAQPEIQRDFGVGPADVGWVVFGFGAAFAVTTVLWGAIGRRFGIGRALALAIGLLSAASIGAAMAPDLVTLVGARVLQGAAAGAIPTLGTSLIGSRFSGARRVSALGVWIGAVGLGQAVGPLLGGALIDLFDWHAVVGFSAIAAPAALVVLRAHPAAGDAAARVDLVGAVLVGAAVLSAVFLLNRLPVVGIGPLSLAIVGVLLIASIALGWHILRRNGRLLPREVVLDPTYRRLAALGAIGMSALLGCLVIMPIAVAQAQGRSGLELGILLVPMALATVLISPNSGRVIRRLGRRTPVRFALAMLASGALALALLGAAAAPALIAAAMVPLGIGFSLLNPSIVDQLMIRFEGALAPIAVGSYNLVFFLGGSVGAALTTALVQRDLHVPLLSDALGSGYPTALVLLAIAPTLAALLAGRAEPSTATDTAETAAIAR